MDSLTEDSFVLPIVLFADRVDRLLHSSLFKTVEYGLLALYWIWGSWLEYAVLICTIALEHPPDLGFLAKDPSIWHNMTPRTALGFGISTLGTIFMIFTLLPTDIKQKPWMGPSKPFLIPSRTSHTRFFPQKHSFSYSYLTVGVPIGFRGSSNGMLSADIPCEADISQPWYSKLMSKCWFDVNSDDYLARGFCKEGLRGKLDDYLASQVRIKSFAQWF